MAGTAWRRAATLILSGRGGGDELALLMLRRSGRSRHLPDASVFPGGVTELCDFSGAWKGIFSLYPVQPLLCEGVDRPATFLERPPVGDDLPAELGFRLTALRETFEETGVLLVRGMEAPHRPRVLPLSLAEEWRLRVQKDPTQLLQMARQLAVVPDVWSLHEWSTWLTPLGVPGHRHDTAFFVTNVPERPECRPCGDEAEQVEWCRPVDVLAAQVAGTTRLMPPQIYELGRLQRFSSWTALERFSRLRAGRGLSRHFPVILRTSDGVVVGVLPGDELYPAVPATEGERRPLEIPETLQQVMSGARRHRNVHELGPSCSVEMPYGHVAPVLFPAGEEDMIHAEPESSKI